MEDSPVGVEAEAAEEVGSIFLLLDPTHFAIRIFSPKFHRTRLMVQLSRGRRT